MAPGEEQRCASCGELNPARAKFCLECGTQLKVDIVDQLPQENGSSGERRMVSVLFADLSGFTAYSEGSDVEDVRAIAQETAGRLGDIVERYGGTVDKIIGDCVMAVWGAPVAHEDDADRAVRAALEMQACVAENQERFAGLTLCVGIQSGEAMWSPVGPDGRYTVLGDTVNTAARLQGAAARGTVVIGEPTHQAISDAIECEALEPIKAKNKAEPVPAWLATGVKGERAAHKPVLAPLHGRDDELNRLREVWEHVRTETRPYAVTVLGSAGVGKSRLVSALTEPLGASARVLRGRCLAYGEGITYWPVIEIIQQVAQVRHDDDRETVSHKLGALLEGLGSDDLDELRTMAVALANLIGSPTTPRGTYTATEISKGELHWGLKRIFELSARHRPLVLVLEDLHWAEPTLLELIEFIFDSSAQAPILGIGTGRPELKDSGAQLLVTRPNRRVIELDALTDDAARGIVIALVGRDDIPQATLDELLHTAGGNPLFLEEVAQVWRESGDAALSDLRIPSSLQALIDSRLDGLSAPERRVVTRAAVVGDVFWKGTVAHLDEGRADISEELDGLERRDLIRSNLSSTVTGEREYAFKHGLIRDAAYARLTKVERAKLHQRCGDWMGELPAGREEFAEIIAYHLEQACRIASDVALAHTDAPILPAARALMRAGEKAEAREGMPEASRFLERALDLLGDAFPETSIEMKGNRARQLFALGRYEEAQATMSDVAAGGMTLGRFDLRCRALLSLAEMNILIGAATEAQSHLDDGERLARDVGDPSLRVRASWTRAQLYELVEGPSARVVETLQSAIALAEETDDSESALIGRLRLGALLFNMGQLEPAQIQFERCTELAKERGTLRTQSWLTAILGLIRFHRGPRSDAEELYAKASDWMERTSDRYFQCQTLVWWAAAALDQGDLGSALQRLRAAEPLAGSFGGSMALRVGRYLAEALARQGRTAEVRELVAQLREQAPEEDGLAQADSLVAEAFAAIAHGDDAEARRSFSQALPILENRGNSIDLGEARVTFARALESFGDLTAAGDQLDRAREVFDKVGALATIDEIESDLARLRDIEIESATAGKSDRSPNPSSPADARPTPA